MILEVAAPVPVLKTFDYELPAALAPADPASLPGRRVRIPFGFRTAVGVVCAVKESSASAAGKLKSILSFVDEEPVLTERLLSLGLWLSERFLCSPGEGLFALMPPDGKSTFQDPGAHAEFHQTNRPFALTDDQKAAAAQLHDIVFGGEHRVVVLRGVAAAGKTEVYLSAIQDVLTMGRTVLYLVPEIGLAAQAADLLRARFGDASVVLWHSDLSLKQRRESWWRVRRSEAQIVVGARSAALAPLDHIGLIVVDEEQDSAYKEERKPRFHARDVALRRARDNNAVALLGSATPSLETYHAALTGAATLIEIDERAVAAAAPATRLIDLKQEKYRGALSAPLQAALSATLARHDQAILFLNRRGFHRFLRCGQCAWVARCERCGVAYVHHKGTAAKPVAPPPGQNFDRKKKAPKPLSGQLSCHLCGHKAPIPTVCPECKAPKLHAGGTGTERLAEDVVEAFPWARVLRWDSDTAAKHGSHEAMYRQFAEGNADVLIGTQVVAQGFNFPKVTLVGVVDADVPLFLPDFRAAERAFQHVVQVAGRAGREMVGGEVIIQTRHADHYALAFAARLDYAGFAEAELRFREDLNYPPFSHVILVRTDAKDMKRAESDMERLVTWLTADDAPLVGVLGPMPARGVGPAARQLQCLIKVPSGLYEEFLRRMRAFLAENGGRFWIDADPEQTF